ncbi:DNA-binding transcriptional LysR family regulator [Bacillus ectoiniformans]|uniref:LysR substrate-binding domain-containing protein n=1 Tax=Bacillus ectoiniformans TaxID=1494429 RepID=UPI0019583721|nr:LysR substrate-binding domain-containing protein [Bacillus ectoiniformans]MBM7649531.1 DNA-binding transcriptional LysR family regulator [Bacillus ectoiniformans]
MDQKLKVFLTVVKYMNFSKAAEELFITQPAVSQYIKSLEQELNIKLIDRTNKKVRLTKAGSLVAYYAKEMFVLKTKMKQAVSDLTSEVKGKLAVGASYSYGEYILPHVLADFLRQFPHVEPVITIGNTHDIASKVQNQEIDLGIVEGSFPSEKLHKEKIATDRMFVIKSRKHQPKKPIHLNEETWIVREEGSGTREAVDMFLKKHNIQPEKTLEFGSTQIIKEAVEAGLGVSLLSEWTIRNELELDKLKVIGGEQLYFERSFYAITSGNPLSTKTTATFLDFLNQYFLD